MEWSWLCVLLTSCSLIPVLTNTRHSRSRASISAGAAMYSMEVIVPLVLTKVAFPSWKVLITAIPSSCRMSLNLLFLEEDRLSRLDFLSSFLRAPIRSLRSVMMQGVLLLGVSWSIFLSQTAKPSSVSALLALHCNLGSASYMLTTCLGFQSFLFMRVDTLAAIFEHLVFSYLPSYFEMSPMVGNGRSVR